MTATFFNAWVDYDVVSYSGGILYPSFGSGGTGGFTFINVGSGGIFDPPFTDTYEYTGLDGTLFSSIVLPTGFGSLTVLGGPGFSTNFGTFAGGSTVNFGTAQSAFRVGGISPAVDVEDPAGFPLQIFFTTETGSFSQIAAPEPGTWIQLVTGAMGLLAVKLRRKRNIM